MKEIVTVNLPDIGEGVVEGEVVEWLKNVGDPLKQDEPVVVVMTDKATVELPAPYPGTLAKQYFLAGQIAIKGRPLYDIECEKGSSAPQKEEKANAPKTTSTTCVSASSKSVDLDESKCLATPAVRHLAKQLGVSLEVVVGTGEGGRILAEDVKKHLLSSAPQEKKGTQLLRLSDDEVIPLSGIRAVMAEKMAETHRTIPQFSYFDELSATPVIRYRENLKKKDFGKVTYMPLYIKALSLALNKVPLVNSCVDIPNKSILIHKQHNIGIAINTEKGLVVPVLKHVEKLSLREVIATYEKLKDKALAGSLDPADLKEATITITNFGTLGGLGGTPMINAPEVAILGLSKMERKPVVVDDKIEIADIQPLYWSFDHRIIDGATAAAVSNAFKALLVDPDFS